MFLSVGKLLLWIIWVEIVLFLFVNSIFTRWTNLAAHFFYITFYWLYYYSCPNFFPFAPHPAPPTPSGNSPPLFMSMGHAYKFFAFSIFYTVLTSPWLFCNYLYVLRNTLTPSPVPPQPPPIRQTSKPSPYPCFCLCACLLTLFFRFNCW